MPPTGTFEQEEWGAKPNLHGHRRPQHHRPPPREIWERSRGGGQGDPLPPSVLLAPSQISLPPPPPARIARQKDEAAGAVSWECPAAHTPDRRGRG